MITKDYENDNIVKEWDIGADQSF